MTEKHIVTLNDDEVPYIATLLHEGKMRYVICNTRTFSGSPTKVIAMKKSKT